MTPSTNVNWLAQIQEDVLEPELPIIDPHHHLWEFRDERVAHRYLLDEILADMNSGHNIVATVHIECGSMYTVDREPPYQQASWDEAGVAKSGRNVSGPDLFIDPVFHKGFANLASRNLSFEAWCYHPQIPQVTELARA